MHTKDYFVSLKFYSVFLRFTDYEFGFFSFTTGHL